MPFLTDFQLNSLGLHLSRLGCVNYDLTASGYGRPPGVNDDTAHGNVVGALWLNTSTGLLYQASDVTNGAAVWVLQTTPSVYPGDAVSGFTAIYGTRAMKATWVSGNFCDVVRASDSTSQTVVFINGTPDLATLASFGSGTTLAVSKWYDQSGNGNDAVQTVAANRPGLWIINGKVHIAFDGVMAGNAAGSSRDKWLTVPNAITLNKRAMSLAFVGAAGWLTDLTTSLMVLVDLDASGVHSGGILAGYGAGGLPTPWVLSDNDAIQVVNGGYGAQTQQNVLLVTGGATATVSVNQSETTGLTAYANQSGVGVRIGASALAPGEGYYGTLEAVMLHPSSALSSPNRETLRRSLYESFSIPPQEINDLVFFTGDSAEVSWGGIPESLPTGIAGYGIPQQTLEHLTRPVTAFNVAAPGVTLAQLTAKIADYNSVIYRSAARKNIMVLCWNGSEIESGARTGAQAFTDFQTWLSTIKATSWGSGNILVQTPIEFIGDPHLADKQTFNNSLRSNAVSLGYTVIDDSVDPRLIDTSNPTYFWQSGIYAFHLTSLGSGVRASYRVIAINAILDQLITTSSGHPFGLLLALTMDM